MMPDRSSFNDFWIRSFKTYCISFVLGAMVFAAVVSAFAQQPAPQQQANTASVPGPTPDELVNKVAQDVLKDLSANRAEYRKSPEKLRQLVDKHLLPHFDTEYAAQLVLAKHWRTATPEQRKRFIDAFYQSLLQDYGEAMLDFTPDRLKILPYRGEASAKQATVRTEVRRDDGSRVPVNFTLRPTPQGWKAYDLTIEGISYVRSFRTDFGAEIEQKGIDAVIERLRTQGVKSAAGKKTTSKTTKGNGGE